VLDRQVAQVETLTGVHQGDTTRYLHEAEGVPLTPEILKKNGWKYEFDKKKYMVKYDLKKEGKDCWMMWSIDEKTLDLQRQDADLLDIYNLCVQHVVIPCNYVHELQHALRLCGIDKEITL
jgi:hypothetical protein